MTLDEIDEALIRLPVTPTTDEDLDARAKLMQRRFDAIAAEREAIACRAAAERKMRWGLPLANVPNGVSCVQFHTGRTVYADVVDGGLKMQLSPGELRLLSLENEAWTSLNPELAAR